MSKLSLVVALIVSLVASALAVPEPVDLGRATAAFAPAEPGGTPSKRYCRRHKRKCRRNLKNRYGHARVRFTTTAGSGATQTRTYSTAAQQEQGCSNTGDNEFWQCNGGIRSRRGQAVVHSISWAKGNLFNDTFYKMHHKTYFRWRARKIRKIVESWYLTNVSWYFRDESRTQGTLGYPWYKYFRGVRRSGHKRHIGWRIESCFTWFCAQFYPYARNYVHGNGTFHASGHNW